MTTFSTRTGTGSNVLITDYDVKKIFIFDNNYDVANLTNSTYDAIDYPAGLILGQVAATGEVVPLNSAASDGSQYPIGILSANVTIEGGDTREVPFCVAGDVAEEMLVFTDADTLETVIEGKQLRARIGSDTVGVKLRFGTDQTRYDN